MQDPFCHSSSIQVNCPAHVAFELLADGIKQGTWAWGSFNRTEIKPGLFKGTSVFSGQDMLVRLHADPARLCVDYEVGPTEDAMQFRNMSRVIPGEILKIDPNSCVVSLLTWRLSTQSDADWAQISTVHEAEMFLIKGLLERSH